MTKCIHTLQDAIEHDSQSKIIQQLISPQSLSQLKTMNFDTTNNQDIFYNITSDEKVINQRLWKQDPKYFKKVYISALALMKMTIHSKSGGSIEIMGMLTGKIIEGKIIVLDVYSLPVEGTETRVNAQAEAYEYMVQYLQQLKNSGHEENIVGWYHSHPGYGCWLSGIDVATQKLNQDFQDPYLAIVIDPIRTINTGKVEIGAFRTLPDNYKSNEVKSKDGNGTSARGVNQKFDSKKIKKLKQQDFGSHADKYYSLDIEIFKSKQDDVLLNILRSESWMNNLVQTVNYQDQFERSTIDKILSIVTKLQLHEVTPIRNRATFLKGFRNHFESVIVHKLMDESLIKNKNNVFQQSDKTDAYISSSRSLANTFSPTITTNSSADNIEEENEGEDSEDSRSDFDENDKGKGHALDISDADDAISLDSSRPPSRRPNNESTDGDIVEEEDEGDTTDVSMDDINDTYDTAKYPDPVPTNSKISKTQIFKTGNKTNSDDDELNVVADDAITQFNTHKRLIQGNRRRAIKNQQSSKSSLRDGMRSEESYDNKNLDLLESQLGLSKFKKGHKGIDHIDKEAKKAAGCELNNLLLKKTQQRLFL